MNPEKNRITGKLSELAGKREKGLIAYLTAGYPDFESSINIIGAMADSGADMIEIGIPFSDPIADGPVIQKASSSALALGIKLEHIFSAVQIIRRMTQLPLIFMTYYNPVLQYGIDEFISTSFYVGVDGIIVPDLPYEEVGPLLTSADKQGLALIPLVAPTSTPRRLEAISRISRGFVYCVSITGVTGARKEITTDISNFTSKVRCYVNLPIAVGFGISGPVQASAFSPYCDAVVVGSAFVDLIGKGAGAENRVARLVREIKEALLNPIT